METQKREYHKTVLDKEGNIVSSDGDVFLYGVKIKDDNRLKPLETREERIVFSRSVDRIDSVSAEVYFNYQAVVAEKTEMRIPFDSVRKKMAR